MTNTAKSLGARLPRLEATGKINGSAKYTDDLARPFMLHGAILGSPFPHAKILSCDASKARALPGVEAVITGQDFPYLPLGAIVKDETVLARGKVRYVGEPVAAVAAVDRETAAAALRLIDVEYEELPAVLDIDTALAADAPIIHEDLADYFKIFDCKFDRNVLSEQSITEGDVDAAFAKCDLVVEGDFTTQAQAHAYLEPSAALVEIDDRNKLTVWSSHQSINRVQANVCEALGLPMTQVRVITPRVGGGFGGKMEATVQPIAAALALRTRQSVKITLSREDDFAMMRTRHPARVWMKTGAMRDGTLVAREARLIYDGGAYSDDSPGVLAFGLYMARGPYNIPNYRASGKLLYTNKLRSSGFRGFGNPQVTFAGESQLDEIAEKLGIDPIDLRLKNAIKKGDKWVGGQTVTSCGFTECLQQARRQSGWDAKRVAANKSSGEHGVRRGIGIAALAHICGVLGTSAIVRLSEDGSIVLNTGAVDIGQGADTALAQICAENLKVDVSRINLVAPDTDASPYNWGTGASRVTYMAGRAVSGATTVLKKKIFEHAAAMLECSEQDLELAEGGVVRVEGTDRKVSFFEISLRSHYGLGGPIIGEHAFVYDGEPFDPKRTTMVGFPFSNLGAHMFGAQVVEVDVDVDTGRVTPVAAWLAHDVGKAINPLAVEGQIQGGFVQGLGYSLYEELVWDNGRLSNPTMMDYKIPGSLDVPLAIKPIIVEEPEPSGPFGAKGVGEPGIIGVAPAVANAVAHATGTRIHQIPLTAERVLSAIDISARNNANRTKT
jgi:CO/xanthine dehydrogenase Mo-binding subunit